jgi:hypothetical protein
MLKDESVCERSQPLLLYHGIASLLILRYANISNSLQQADNQYLI